MFVRPLDGWQFLGGMHAHEAKDKEKASQNLHYTPLMNYSKLPVKNSTSQVYNLSYTSWMRVNEGPDFRTMDTRVQIITWVITKENKGVQTWRNKRWTQWKTKDERLYRRSSISHPAAPQEYWLANEGIRARSLQHTYYTEKFETTNSRRGYYNEWRTTKRVTEVASVNII